jgi:hypothetical protein
MDTFSFDTLSTENKIAHLRLMAKIQKFGSPRSNHGLSGCWTHTTAPSSNGYGQIVINNKTWNLHRLSWWLHNGCPTDGNFYDRKWEVAHACDNKECANPEHLSLETAQKNKEDAVTRIRVIKPAKEKIRATVACNECRKDRHHKCEGTPCSVCVKKGVECVREEHVPSSGSFKESENAGENNIKAVLTKINVLEIRTRYMKGLKYGEMKKMTEEYPVKYGTIQAIVSGRIWKEKEFFPEGWP